MNQPALVAQDQSIANGMMNIMGMFDPKAIAAGKHIQAQTENLGEDTRGKRLTNDVRTRRVGKAIYKRDADGNIVVGINGKPILEDTGIEGDVLFGGIPGATNDLVVLDGRGFRANNEDARGVLNNVTDAKIKEGNASSANRIAETEAAGKQGRLTQAEKAQQEKDAAEAKQKSDLALAVAKAQGNGEKTGPLPVDTWGAFNSKENAWDMINKALLDRGSAFNPNQNVDPAIARSVTNRATEYLRLSRGRLSASQALQQSLKDFGATGGTNGMGNFGTWLFDGKDRASLVNEAGNEITPDMFRDAESRLGPINAETISSLLGVLPPPVVPPAPGAAPGAAAGATGTGGAPAASPPIPPPESRPVGTKVVREGKTYEWRGPATGWVLVGP